MSTQQDIVVPLPSPTAVHISEKGVPAPSTQPQLMQTEKRITTAKIPASAKQKDIINPSMDNHQTKKQKGTMALPKVGSAKKPKRFSPYNLKLSACSDFDDSPFLDTPILEASEVTQWAMVAGPKQLPMHK